MRKNIAVVCGGYSSERVVSLRSADYVLDNLDRSNYDVYKVVIDKEHWFCLYDAVEYPINKNDFSVQLEDQKVKFDLVYNIIHGDPGENGRLQAYFELLRIPFTSSDSTVSSLTFNKAYCNHIVKSLGVNVSPSVHLLKQDAFSVEAVLSEVGLPCFVKPNSGGSSIGMSKVKVAEELKPAIEKAFQEDDEVLVEAFFSGREITCGLLESNGKIFVFPICEVVSKKEFFDYEAKYDESLVDEIIPAQIPEDVAEVVKSTSVYLYKNLNMKGVVRMDYLFEGNEYIFLEVNTIPGMSAQSIVPQMARAFGWTNTQLLDAVLANVVKE